MTGEASEGEIFTRFYAAANSPLSSDSERARNRLSGLVSLFWKEMKSPRDFVKREIGIDIANGHWTLGWDEFIKTSSLHDVLDVISALHRLSAKSSPYSEFKPSAWRYYVQRIFDEERLSYVITPSGAVRFRVDAAFEAERTSAIAALNGARYTATRASLDEGFAGFDASPPDTRAAIRGTFDAIETLFKLMFPRVSRLGSSEVDRALGGALEAVYSGASLDFARLQIKSLCYWVNAAHMYRHAQGVEEPDPPALDLAIQSVGAGAAYLRWLATIDQQMQAEQNARSSD
jgi:hypothetical protein